MTTLEKFQSLNVKARESFISALGMFRELDAPYRAKINAQKTETSSESDVDNDLPFAPTSKKSERLRERIALDIWEPTTRRELVDRLTNLVVNRIVTSRDLERAIVDAKRRRDVYERTGGRDGVERTQPANGERPLLARVGRGFRRSDSRRSKIKRPRDLTRKSRSF